MKSPHVKYYQQSIYTRISAAHAINTADQRFAYTANTDGHTAKFSKISRLCHHDINGAAAYGDMHHNPLIDKKKKQSKRQIWLEEIFLISHT